MNCINCGARISDERKTCPYCGQSLQIVPDYSIYDDDDINILMDEITPPKKEKTAPKTIDREAQRQKARKEREKQRTLEMRKKRQMAIILFVVITVCAILFMAFFIVNDMIARKNTSSYSYQIKQAEQALEDGDFHMAEEYYLRALALEPNDLDVRFTMAELYSERNMTDAAVNMYKEILGLDKENYTAYKALFQIYSNANDVDAIMELRKGVTNQRILALFQDYAVENPKIYLDGGTYQGEISVMISSKLNYEIYYTIDGSDPTENGILYTGTVKINKMGLVTLKAVAKNQKGIFSDVVSETYVLEFAKPADPIVTPDGGNFDRETYISISVPTGCTAYYTWDGTNPTIDSLTKFEYTEPLLIPSGKNVLSVLIYDNKTGLSSGIYRRQFTCTVEGIEVPIIILPEEPDEETGADSDIDSDINMDVEEPETPTTDTVE